MNAPKSSRIPRQSDLEGQDLSQEIDAPLEDREYRDEATLSRIDFDEVEFALDL